MQKVVVIGAGFSSLAAAAFLAKAGYEVTVLEKNSMSGGRAQHYTADGFTFDMGPSWYWMPDVFEHFFQQFGYQVSDFYQLKRLDPSYEVVWSKEESWTIPAGTKALGHFLEQYESGAGQSLDRFIKQAGVKYSIAMADMVKKPSVKWTEFLQLKLLTGLFQLDLFSSMKGHVAKHFTSTRIKQLFEFPVLFLGASAGQIPALYSLMNYADVALGTWYPMGGFLEIAKAMQQVAEKQGVQFKFNEGVSGFEYEGDRITRVKTAHASYEADLIVSGADYHFTEQLLPQALRSYSEAYWDKRVLAPSCLLYYIGLDCKLPDSVKHHTLFFDTDFQTHDKEIYETPKMPSDPLFYMCCPSKTDPSVAPEGKENLFLLIPIAPGLTNDDEATRERYFDELCARIANKFGVDIKPHIIHKRSFSSSNFKMEYNSFKGNAYGLANTLMQTAVLKPKIKSKKVSNLYYTGQLTVPGPGVPPSLISGELVAQFIQQEIPSTK